MGCSSLAKQWKSLISGGDNEEAASAKPRPSGATFSQQNNLPPANYRKYKRTNRKNFEDGAHLESKSGSLWVMEGQGAYLFSQNIVRMIGDPLAVKIEGEPSEQLASKAKIISKLLAQLEDRRRRALGRTPAGEEKKDQEGKPAEKAPGAPEQGLNANNPTAPTGAGLAAAPTAGAQNNTDENTFGVKSVPTRVVERTIDGNYRVRGTQPFMIGQREYKVIVTGIVRAEDFNEDGVSASQLLDANYDIVSSKSSEIK